MSEFKFKNLNNEIIAKQEVSLGFMKLIENFKKETTDYNNGIPMPFYFDHSKNIKINMILQDRKKIGVRTETYNVSFPINDKKNTRSFMIYLSDTNPVKECIAAHEICHGLLYARGFKIVKHKEKKFGAFEGEVISFAHHFPLHEVFKEYDLEYGKDIIRKSENIIKKNIEILQQIKYNGSNKDMNIARTFQCLGFSYISDRSARRRLERLIRSLPSEIYDKYEAIRSIVGSMPATELITQGGCMKIMIEILKLYKAEDEFIKDFDGFDDYLTYEELLGK